MNTTCAFSSHSRSIPGEERTAQHTQRPRRHRFVPGCIQGCGAQDTLSRTCLHCRYHLPSPVSSPLSAAPGGSLGLLLPLGLLMWSGGGSFPPGRPPCRGCLQNTGPRCLRSYCFLSWVQVSACQAPPCAVARLLCPSDGQPVAKRGVLSDLKGGILPVPGRDLTVRGPPATAFVASSKRGYPAGQKQILWGHFSTAQAALLGRSPHSGLVSVTTVR